MAWKSPRRQHGEGGVIKASSSQSQPLFSSPAETQVREIASKIGLFEGSEILAAVCQHMREQYVVEAWQLPDLDSRQWEKMNAPIGLAVAVKHISAHRLREQEIQRQFQEGYFKKNGKTMHEEEKEEDIEQTTCCDRNIFPSPSLPGWSSKKKERTNESEIEAKTISDEGTLGSKVDQNVMEVEANKASINISAITYDTKIKDEEAVTEKVASVSEDEPFQERNSQPLQSDNAETKNGFIEECADWLKLVMVATAKEDEETLSRVLKIDVENDDDHTGVIDSNVKPLPSTTTGEIEQANVEPVKETDPKTTRSLESKAFATPVKTKTADSLELDNLAPSTFVEKREEKLKSGIELSNIAKREISMAIEKDAEPTQVKAEPVDGMEQESSTQPAKVESEQQESQVEIRSTKRTEDGCLIVIHCEERSLVENDSEDGKDSLNKSINIEKHLEKEICAREKEETPEAISSDSESDVNSNIFSGIPNNVSFSEDEDDHIPGDKESADESTEFNPISSMSDLKATRSLLPENYADDITVSHSNVSPEGKKSASIRKNKAQNFPHEYDRESSSFEIETASLQKILVDLPTEDHRSILSQLMIMTNARQPQRTNIAFQVQDSLVALIETHEIDMDPAKAVQIIFHLSRMKKSYRSIFGKSLFRAMSKLYKQSEKDKDSLKVKKSPKKKKRKNSISSHKNLVQDDEGPLQHKVTEKDENHTDRVQVQ